MDRSREFFHAHITNFRAWLFQVRTNDPMAADIALTYTLTADDLVRSWRQHFRAKVFRSKWAFWSAIGAAVYLLGTVGFAIYCSDWTLVWLVASVIAIVPGLMAFNYFVVAPLSAPRSYACGMTFDVRIVDDGISWRGGQIDASHSWARFIDIAEGRDFFLLYFGQATYFAVPMRAFTDQSGIEAFRKLIANRKEEVPLIRNAESGAPPDEFAGQDGIAMRFRFTEAEQVMLLRDTIFRAIAQSKSPLVLYGLLVVFAVYGIVMALTARFEPIHIVMVAPAIFSLSGLMSYYFIWTKREVRKSPTYGRDQSVFINDSAIVIYAGIGWTSMAWSGVTAISEKGGLLILRRGANEFLALAKRGFASPADEARFHEMVTRYIPGR